MRYEVRVEGPDGEYTLVNSDSKLISVSGEFAYDGSSFASASKVVSALREKGQSVRLVKIEETEIEINGA